VGVVSELRAVKPVRSSSLAAMEEVENHMNQDTLKEIRQEYSTLRV
jgi:hypothetical protein